MGTAFHAGADGARDDGVLSESTGEELSVESLYRTIG